MTTTAAGDSAVARLNKATESFEKIITGASNQVVDVPGYGNQPTLAARVDERLDETTATAAAEANRSRDEADHATNQANAAANSVTRATAEYNKAKAQADRAQSEADRAAQITGLETVADAIGMAALPFPDVWAPLSDSLRLITGYGRDVLVGSDVVARMVNFSRNSTATYIGKDGQLKTAAANEARFEKEGLLIEGQSTNYIPKSEYYADYVKSNIAVSGKVLTRSVTAGESYLNIGTYNLPTGKITISAAYKKSSAVNFYCFNVYCDRFTPRAANLVKVKEVGDLVVVAATFDADFSAGSAGIFFKLFMVGDGAGSVQLEYLQMESMPFATSHIQTSGAAATRAADSANIHGQLNLPDAPQTIAMTVNMLGDWQDATKSRRRLYFCGSAYSAAREFTTPALFYYCGDTSLYSGYIPTSVKNSQLVFRRDVGYQSAHQDGTMKNSALVSQFAAVDPLFHIGCNGGVEQLFGHIRNLRIWFRPLTNEQLNGVV